MTKMSNRGLKDILQMVAVQCQLMRNRFRGDADTRPFNIPLEQCFRVEVWRRKGGLT